MLTVDSLVVGYGDTVAVTDISLHVDEGEAVAIIGANGAGKTTLLRALCGLLPVRSGAIRYDGMSIVGRPAHRIARDGVAFVPAERHLFAGMSVRENLTLGAYPDRADPGQLHAVYELFPNLADRQLQRAGTLSGGEQQMLAIGRALMARPRLLVLDEPTTGLAPVLADDTYASLSTLRRHGLTLLLAEQQVPLALDVADRGYVMDDGRIVLHGSAADLGRDPGVRRAYLGTS